jgi:hypothetical protein
MGFLANYIMQGRIQAITVASACALLSLLFPPVNIVSSATVALITLRRGGNEGCYVLIASGLICVLLGFLVDNYQFPLFYALVLWVPLWLGSIILRESRDLLIAVEFVIAMVSMAIVLVYFYQPDLATVWQALLNDFLEPVLIKSNPTADLKAIQYFLSLFYRFIITGLIAQVYVFILLASLFLARWWQAVLYNQGGFAKEYLAVKCQPQLAALTLVIFVIGLFAEGVIAQICWAIVLLLFTLYAFVGTIVLHYACMSLKTAGFLVPFLYVTVLIIPYMIILVALIGLVDTWLNLRTKILNRII